MNRLIFFVCIFVSSSCFASSLQEQLASVAQAEQQGKAEEQRLLDAQMEKKRLALKAHNERVAAQAAAKAAAAAKVAAENRAIKEKVAAEAYADKKRNQGYEDSLRDLEIQKQKLALAREEARVKRENDFIDQELKSKAAQTDVIQSHADANRNISEGGRDLLQSEGKAREKDAGGWFN